MRILGLDPSTSGTGIAVVTPFPLVATVIFAEEISFKKETGFQRANMIMGRVMEIWEQYQPDLVVIESMFVGHASSAIPIIQLGSIIRYFLWQEGIQFLEVGATSLKKYVSGTGGGTKDQMMMNVLKKWGYESKTNNIADAVGLGMFGLACLPGATPNAFNNEIISKVLKAQPAMGKYIQSLK